MRRKDVGIADETYLVARGDGYGGVAVGEIVVGCTDFGTFGVDEYADALGYLADVVDDFGESVER